MYRAHRILQAGLSSSGKKPQITVTTMSSLTHSWASTLSKAKATSVSRFTTDIEVLRIVFRIRTSGSTRTVAHHTRLTRQWSGAINRVSRLVAHQNEGKIQNEGQITGQPEVEPTRGGQVVQLDPFILGQAGNLQFQISQSPPRNRFSSVSSRAGGVVLSGAPAGAVSGTAVGRPPRRISGSVQGPLRWYWWRPSWSITPSDT